jgi:hypothetical protein
MTCAGGARCQLIACDGGMGQCPAPYACGPNSFCSRPLCDAGTCPGSLVCNTGTCVEP